MAIIMQIEKKPRIKNVFVIAIDTGEYFDIYDEYIVMSRLKVGKEISEEELKQIAIESMEKIANQYCLQTLTKGMKTKKELFDKLLQKNITEDVATIVLKKLENYGYINDNAYAELYISIAKDKKGIYAIKRELELKGIDKELIEELFENREDDFEVASKIAEKYMRNKENTYKNKSKLYAHLVSKGFGYDTINALLNLYNWNNDKIE